MNERNGQILLTLLLLLAISGRASAQLAPPMEADLKAAYCLRITERQIGAVPLMGRTEEVNKVIGEARDRRDRLQSYLTPRKASLDAAGLAAATKRADSDSDQLAELTDRCMNSGLCTQGDTPDGCASKLWACMEGGLQTRVHVCDDLIWLPY